MKNLWAPWRLDYILDEKEEGCIFCHAVQKEEDSTRHVAIRGDACFCILNKFPYNVGHLMIAPNRHVSRLNELDEAELVEMVTLAQRLEDVLTRMMRPDGFNIGFNLGKAAGAGIEAHLHLHIVPRWEGDTNFMPVLGDTRVVPQALDKFYDNLMNALAEETE
ncbi:MAG: HIT domain-containing protein [Planctomycetota bacterium]|jgi:ATP adenylyltransferase|nr:HIT domain-containing protein [Planctomycetota bacterium]MDP7251119.1 HIT domain-containing protein [Planctomycetota bacterium]